MIKRKHGSKSDEDLTRALAVAAKSERRSQDLESTINQIDYLSHGDAAYATLLRRVIEERSA